MSDFPGADEASDEIHAEFAMPIRYTGAGLTAAAIAAVRADRPADAFQGPGATARQVSFEVRMAALPSSPAKRDLIVENDGAGQRWLVIDVTRRDDVNAWVLIVERTS